jgi:DNA-binding transcriptional LysR family regulator
MAGPVRSPEIAELRAFCAAIDLGSLGRAARLVRVSQPALSKRLRTLEALAGGPLLERSPRGVTPTPAGRRLYAEARKLLAHAEAVDGLMAGLHEEERPVRLAASHTIAEFVLPAPLVDFEGRRDRHLSVELVIANSRVVHDVVREGRADFGIAAQEGADAVGTLREMPFLDDEVIVGAPPAHPWAGVEEIPLDDFLTTPMIMRDPGANTRRVVESALGERGLSLAPPLAEVGSTSAAKAAALAEGAPLLLSRLGFESDGEKLACRRVSGLRFPRSFVILLGAEETMSRGTSALLAHLRAAVGPGHNQGLAPAKRVEV